MINIYIYFTAKHLRNIITHTHIIFLEICRLYKAYKLMGGFEPLTSTLPMWCCFFRKERDW